MESLLTPDCRAALAGTWGDTAIRRLRSLARRRDRLVATGARLLAGIVAAWLATTPCAVAAENPSGLWITAEKDAHIKVGFCPPEKDGVATPATDLCGSIAWLQTPNDDAGRPKLDHHNEDPAKRTRPLVGLPLFEHLTLEDDRWHGKIYNPDNGKVYEAYFRLVDPKHAELKGCVAFVLCGSQTWTRN